MAIAVLSLRVTKNLMLQVHNKVVTLAKALDKECVGRQQTVPDQMKSDTEARPREHLQLEAVSLSGTARAWFEPLGPSLTVVQKTYMAGPPL